MFEVGDDCHTYTLVSWKHLINKNVDVCQIYIDGSGLDLFAKDLFFLGVKECISELAEGLNQNTCSEQWAL